MGLRVGKPPPPLRRPADLKCGWGLMNPNPTPTSNLRPEGGRGSVEGSPHDSQL